MNRIINKNNNILSILSNGWLILFLGGIGYIPCGLFLVIYSWETIQPPYILGQFYPFGGVMQAWQVSNGFSFMAFGILFCGIVTIAKTSSKTKTIWALLVITYIVMWFPHLWLGVKFMLTNSSLDFWMKLVPFIILWMSFSFLGFYLSWKNIEYNKKQKII